MGQELITTPVLVLTGPVGVGKTAVAEELSKFLRETHVAHAVVDMDWLRQCYPSPEQDPFHTALGLQNLTAVWAHYHTAGARRLVLVDIVETRSAIRSYQAAIPQADVRVVRLTASLPTILRRLEGRESGASLRWHGQRAAELARQMEEQAVEDILIQTEGKTVGEVAEDVLTRIGWARTTDL